MEGSDLVYLRY